MVSSIVFERTPAPLPTPRTLLGCAVLVFLSTFATSALAPDYPAAPVPAAPVPAAAAIAVASPLQLLPSVTSLAVRSLAVPVVLPAHLHKSRIALLRTGMASWYGQDWQDRPTASGRPFDMNQLTAAHKTLPFGTRVQVTDLRNRKSVVVTITDRGTLTPGRVIDLSYAAANVIGMVKSGTAPVSLQILPRLVASR